VRVCLATENSGEEKGGARQKKCSTAFSKRESLKEAVCNRLTKGTMSFRKDPPKLPNEPVQATTDRFIGFANGKVQPNNQRFLA
jgi:hypothetical protein